MKKCPFCAEEIQNEALKCKHCGSVLSSVEVNQSKALNPPKVIYKPKEGLFLQTLNLGCAIVFIFVMVFIILMIFASAK